jgi:hypothetical protein
LYFLILIFIIRQCLEGKLEAPVIRVHKNVVNQADVPLDATPSSTPRLSDDGNEMLSTSPSQQVKIMNR